MTTHTRHGTRVRIIRKLPSFQCNGQEVERVEVENIDGKSVTEGYVTDVNLHELIESKPGEIDDIVKSLDSRDV